MRTFFFYLFFALFPLGLFAKPTVLVSIAPQKYLVERIAGSTVAVEVIVPAGASPHSYEPTPYQTVRMKQGVIWFRIGEGFESRLVPLLKDTKIIDQRDGIQLICGGGCSCVDSCDVHIWLSPRRLEKMATQIEKVLEETFPEHKTFYQEHLATLLKDLRQLDCDAALLISKMPNKTILVSHPAFGYFCEDYGIVQLHIEMEGREPTPRYLTELYHLAKAENIHTVFLQKQYNVKGGEKLAKDLNAKVVYLDPYAENVVSNIRKIAEAFSLS